MPEPAERRRRRPAISCALCRKRKIRCNREVPCSNCVRSKNEKCVYENPPPSAPAPVWSPPRIRPNGNPLSRSVTEYFLPTGEGASAASDTSTAPSHAATSMPPVSTPASTPQTQKSFGDAQSMQKRIHELERQLVLSGGEDKQAFLLPESTYETKTISSSIACAVHLRRNVSSSGPASKPVTRSIMHKTRLFGQSHWINGVTLFVDVFESIEPFVRDPAAKATVNIRRCKNLAKVIKSNRSPAWPLLPTADLPPKDLADELVERYLVTSESIYRVLHIPSFKQAYEELYTSDSQKDMAFIMQVKLVLAIGAVTHDDTFSLRSSALQWIYEAQSWLWAPEYKSRLTIQILQTNLLLLLARELVGVGGDLVWISAGSVLRTAIQMGLHMDPSRLPKRTTFAAEMRRRLWNTILEIQLLTCMTAGGPPLLSTEDFNTEAPGNLDDDQLLSEDPELKSDDQFTQVTVAIALRKTFPIRLKIAKFLNAIGSETTYEETLRLDTELRALYKESSRILKACSRANGPSPSRFDIEVVELIMRRYISSLHVPYIGAAFHEATYAYSRKVIIDNAVKIWAMVYPSSRLAATQLSAQATPPKQSDLCRLTICGSSYSRVLVFQSCLFVAAEVRAQLQEDEGLGLAGVQPHLLPVIQEMKEWCLKCIHAGETNIKGFAFASLVETQINGLIQGIDKSKLPEVMLKSAEDAEEICLEILTKAVNEQGIGTAGCDLQGNDMDLTTSADTSDNWDFMMADAQLDFSDLNPNGWLFHDMNANEFSLW